MAKDDLAFYISGNLPVRISAHYRVVDPAAVILRFWLAGQPATDWTVSRDVLRDSLITTSGLVPGSIFAAGPDMPDTTYVQLYPGRPEPEKRRFLLDRHQLAWFLRKSEQLVPEGTENYSQQVEAFIANALEGAR